MKHWSGRLLPLLLDWLPVLLVLLLGGASLRVALYFLFERDEVRARDFQPLRYLLLATLAGSVLVLAILSAPVSDATHGQLLSFFGILISGAIALSSTTLVSNMMAGLMVRIVRGFRPGDFLRVGEHFGRVTEIALLHTEIQTEDRDLTTLPHLFLVQHPATVVQSCGTVVAGEVTLGYDVSRLVVEEALVEAVRDAGLGDPFVRVMELGDFSVRYRAAGMLEDVKILLTARSQLLKSMLDRLHERDIEIVSPRFVNQRIFSKDETFLYQLRAGEGGEEQPVLTPESRIFDKADAAETREQVLETLEAIGERIKSLEEQRETLSSVELERQVSRELQRLEELRKQLVEALEPEAGPPQAETV